MPIVGNIPTGGSLAAWAPSVADVAALVPTRTGAMGAAGVELRETFDADTRPTATQVQGVIRGVQSEVIAQVGTMPAALVAVPPGGTIGESPAGWCVALGAAALVESQFYPDMQTGGESAASVLERRYRAALAALVRAANEIAAGADPGDQPKPVASFPNTVAAGLATTPWERW